MNRLYLIIMLSMITIFMLLYWKSCSKQLDLESANILLNKKIERTINQKGEETAKNQSLVIENKNLVKQLSESSAVEANLRDRITRLTRAGFNTKTETKYETVTKTDTIIVDSTGSPVYYAEDSSKWIEWAIRVGKDSARLERLKITNELTGVFNEKRSLFKKDQIKLELTNHNPHTTTTEMQSFIYQPKSKRIGLGLTAGYGLTSSGLGPYIGVGVSFNLLSF